MQFYNTCEIATYWLTSASFRIAIYTGYNSTNSTLKCQSNILSPLNDDGYQPARRLKLTLFPVVGQDLFFNQDTLYTIAIYFQATSGNRSMILLCLPPQRQNVDINYGSLNTATSYLAGFPSAIPSTGFTASPNRVAFRLLCT